MKYFRTAALALGLAFNLAAYLLLVAPDKSRAVPLISAAAAAAAR